MDTWTPLRYYVSLRAGNRGISWDEDTLALHRSWAGVEYGRHRIVQADTPFCRYDSQMSRDEKSIVIQDEDGIQKVDITELQRKLGVLERLQEQAERTYNDAPAYVPPEVDPVKRENTRRREMGVLLRKPMHFSSDEEED